jgi:AraC-like DNA-binding protein
MKKALFFFLIIGPLLFSQTNRDVDSLLNLIRKNPDKKVSQEWKDQLIGWVNGGEYSFAKELSKRLLKEAPSIGDAAFEVKTLIFAYRFHNFDEKIKLLNQAASLAIDIGDDKLVGFVYLYKAIAFRDNSMADSAMSYALYAKDLNEKAGTKEFMVGIVQLIADMHYYAGEFEQAEKLYHQIQREEPNHEKIFNYRIVQNNLGLIKIKQHKYEEALRHFKNSLEHVGRFQPNYADSAGLPYIYRKLMETSLLQKNYSAAESYYNSGVEFVKRFKQEIELPGLYIGKGKFLLEKGELDSSLIYLKKAEELEKKYPDLKSKLDMYRAFANTYSKMGRYQEANSWLSLFTITNKTADSLYNRAKVMHLYAEHNYNSAERQIRSYKNERLLYLAILAILLFSTATVLYYYIKLKRSNKFLVEKNLQLAYSHSEEPFNLFSSQDKSLEDDNSPDSILLDEQEKKQKEIDQTILDRITSDLTQLIGNEKVFLDPDLTLVSLSEKLNTNRTYLTKAIQQEYNVNYLDFINGYRIKEAIKILASEESKNLSIDGIAGKSGFNNRVTFAKIFKQSTGMSPSSFMKNLDELKEEEVLNFK